MLERGAVVVDEELPRETLLPDTLEPWPLVLGLVTLWLPLGEKVLLR